MEDSRFRVLMICTANYCRSPMAERLLARAAAEQGLGWQVRSAGTRGYVDTPMHAFAQEALMELDGDAEQFLSRPMTSDVLDGADLILTATREHRAEVVRLNPRVIRRTFTLRQFARLCSFVPGLVDSPRDGLGRKLLAEAQSARSVAPAAVGDEDDLTDPMGMPLDAFRSSASMIARAVADIVRPLAGMPPRGPGDAEAGQ